MRASPAAKPPPALAPALAPPMATFDRYTLLANGLKAQGEQLFLKYFLPYQALDLGIRFEKTWLEWSEDLIIKLESASEEERAQTSKASQ